MPRTCSLYIFKRNCICIYGVCVCDARIVKLRMGMYVVENLIGCHSKVLKVPTKNIQRAVNRDAKDGEKQNVWDKKWSPKSTTHNWSKMESSNKCLVRKDHN